MRNQVCLHNVVYDIKYFTRKNQVWCPHVVLVCVKIIISVAGVQKQKTYRLFGMRFDVAQRSACTCWHSSMAFAQAMCIHFSRANEECLLCTSTSLMQTA